MINWAKMAVFESVAKQFFLCAFLSAMSGLPAVSATCEPGGAFLDYIAYGKSIFFCCTCAMQMRFCVLVFVENQWRVVLVLEYTICALKETLGIIVSNVCQIITGLAYSFRVQDKGHSRRDETSISRQIALGLLYWRWQAYSTIVRVESVHVAFCRSFLKRPLLTKMACAFHDHA